jgi:hypothetical protein
VFDLKKSIQSDVACDSTIRTKFEDRDAMDNRGGKRLKMKEYAKTMSRHQRVVLLLVKLSVF